jgi:hypothetical protein
LSQNIKGYGPNPASWYLTCDHIHFNINWQPYMLIFNEFDTGQRTVLIKYNIHGSDDPELTYYVYTIIVQPTYHVESTNITLQTLLHNYQVQVPNPNLIQNECSETPCAVYPRNISYTYEIINGSQYGELYENTNSGQGIVGTFFIANGVNPAVQDSAMVTVRTTVHLTPQTEVIDPVDYTFRVMHNDGLAPGLNLSIDKNYLAPGDTVQIFAKNYANYGNENLYEVGFPFGTTFEVGITDGGNIGDILTPDNQRGKYFSDMQLPIRFIVLDSISTNGVLVRIRVSAKESTGDLASSIIGKPGIQTNKNRINTNAIKPTIIANEQKNLLSTNIGKPSIQTNSNWNTKLDTISSKNKLSRNLSIKITPEISNSLNSIRMTNKIASYPASYVAIQNPTLKIIYPVKASPTIQNETINSIPNMPNVTCKASYTGGQVDIKNITFEWEYGVSNNLKRAGTNTCSRQGAVLFGGISHAKTDNSGTTEWIVPFKKDSIKNKNVLLMALSQKHCDQKITSWDYGNDVFIGGDVYVQLIAKYNTKTIVWDAFAANKVLGQNPSLIDIKSYINNDKEILTLIEKETYGGNQFCFNSQNKDIKAKITQGLWAIGMPIYGPPNGYGIMQIDNYKLNKITNYANELELWNWKKNVDRGKSIYESYENDAIEYVNNLFFPIIPTQDQLLKEKWQRYNGNKYWGKVNNADGTVSIIKIAKINGEDNPYADDCLALYQNMGEN